MARLTAYRFSLSLAVIVLFGQSAVAQSTIFNIPTTDALTKNKVYLEFDTFVQAPKAEGSDRLSVFVPRGVVGLGRDVEAGANLAVVNQGGSRSVFLQPNMKWRFYNNETTVTAASVGGILYTPVNNRDGVDTYGLLYANVGQKLGKYGPRITVGPYGIVGASDGFAGPEVGAIVGVEQPVMSRLSFVADWFSGKNGFGYFTPGISISLPRNGLLNAGYSIGNDSYHGSETHYNRLVFVYYGMTF
ncbi:MAG: hypothetical protein HYX72_02155 [Acidobacteria bacterium]|nr:hypothetical protein [Acidobacteriota bacterium]